MNIGGIGIWQIALWCLGTLGIAGTIAAIVLYPAIVSLVFRVIVKLFGFVLGYRIGCAIVAGLSVGFAVDYWRHSTDDAEFAQRTALFEHAQKERDARIATETRDEVWKQIADATAENAVIDTKEESFTNAAPPTPAPPSDPYRIDPVSRKQLCDIAGQAGCRPVSTQGVQAHRRPGAHPADRRLPQGIGARAGRPAQSK